jgi:hypothetical protein
MQSLGHVQSAGVTAWVRLLFSSGTERQLNQNWEAGKGHSFPFTPGPEFWGSTGKTWKRKVTFIIGPDVSAKIMLSSTLTSSNSHSLMCLFCDLSTLPHPHASAQLWMACVNYSPNAPTQRALCEPREHALSAPSHGHVLQERQDLICSLPLMVIIILKNVQKVHECFLSVRSHPSPPFLSASCRCHQEGQSLLQASWGCSGACFSPTMEQDRLLPQSSPSHL